MKKVVELHNVLDTFFLAFAWEDDTRVRFLYGIRPLDIVTDKFLITDEDAQYGLSISRLTESLSSPLVYK
jgi:hypothetical protein